MRTTWCTSPILGASATFKTFPLIVSASTRLWPTAAETEWKITNGQRPLRRFKYRVAGVFAVLIVVMNSVSDASAQAFVVFLLVICSRRIPTVEIQVPKSIVHVSSHSCHAPPSEGQPQAPLNVAGSTHGADDCAGAGTAQARPWQIELRVIEEIKELTPELQAETLGNGKLLEH
jgi:hypothetical protein